MSENNCVTHHYACDCREAEHRARVADLESQLAEAEARAADRLLRYQSECQARREAQDRADALAQTVEAVLERLKRPITLNLYDPDCIEEQRAECVHDCLALLAAAAPIPRPPEGGEDV